MGMPLDWAEVIRRYGDGAKVPTVAGGKTLEVTGADEQAVYIRNSLWRDSLQRLHLEKAVELLEQGRLNPVAGLFVEEYRTEVADARATSAAHILKDLGFLS
jgi:hypothetical protein